MSGALDDLESGGFIRKDQSFDPGTGESRLRDFRYLLSDNYLRFSLKYVEPVKGRITKGLFRRAPHETLTAWDTIAGHQFENLVLVSLHPVFEGIGRTKVPVIDAGPYQQGKTLRREACQVDLLIRTKRSVYVVEVKFRHRIAHSVIPEVREKVRCLKLPHTLSVRTALVHRGGSTGRLRGRVIPDPRRGARPCGVAPPRAADTPRC